MTRPRNFFNCSRSKFGMYTRLTYTVFFYTFNQFCMLKRFATFSFERSGFLHTTPLEILVCANCGNSFCENWVLGAWNVLIFGSALYRSILTTPVCVQLFLSKNVGFLLQYCIDEEAFLSFLNAAIMFKTGTPWWTKHFSYLSYTSACYTSANISITLN